MKSTVLLLLFCLVHFCVAKYVLIANADNQANLAKYGYTDYDRLSQFCDSLGMYCAGFNSLGYIKSNMDNLTENSDVSVFVKSEGPAPSTKDPHLWPLPQSYAYGQTTVTVSPDMDFSTSCNSSLLKRGIERYKNIIFHQPAVPLEEEMDYMGSTLELRYYFELAMSKAGAAKLTTLIINVASSDETLQMGVDESYTLNIGSGGSGTLTAQTVYGALRGLETFSQLVQFDYDLQAYILPATPWTIDDYPKFPHRGMLIDTSRHYMPVAVIKRVIDALSFSKLNVLHWHIVDAQSFPVESKTYPKLWEGSWSPKERYTQANLRDIVSYAKDRGVRVIPEFDTPGHSWSWGVGYPEVLPAGYNQSPDCDSTCPVNPCNVPIDPSNELTFDIISGLFGEMTGGKQGAGIFFDNLFHIGGDEVEQGCWNESAQIQSFMAENNMTTFDQLYQYHVSRAVQILMGYGRSPVHWEEVFLHFGNSLDLQTVIHVWLNHETLGDVVAAGYRGILSDWRDWYLNGRDETWTNCYINDPLENITDPSQQELVIGGAACLWGEEIDGSNVHAIMWPRGAAVAERLWTYYTADEQDATEKALPRLHSFRCLLLERGIAAGPVYSVNGPQQPSGCYSS